MRISTAHSIHAQLLIERGAVWTGEGLRYQLCGGCDGRGCRACRFAGWADTGAQALPRNPVTPTDVETAPLFVVATVERESTPRRPRVARGPDRRAALPGLAELVAA